MKGYQEEPPLWPEPREPSREFLECLERLVKINQERAERGLPVLDVNGNEWHRTPVQGSRRPRFYVADHKIGLMI